MLRTVRRWFSDTETKKLAEEIDRALQQVSDVGIKVEALQMRTERHLHKLTMRDARSAARGNGEMILSQEEVEILDDIRRRTPRDDPFRT